MNGMRKMVIAGFLTVQSVVTGAAFGEEGIPDALNGRYRVVSYTINVNACDAEGEHYKGHENTVVKLLADKNVTVPSGFSLSVMNCTDASDTVCANYWNEWFFVARNTDGSWSTDDWASISKGLDPGTCNMLNTVKKVSRSGNNVILESRGYSNPPFEYVPVSADKAACDDLGLVKKHKDRLTRCDNYTKAVLSPL